VVEEEYPDRPLRQCCISDPVFIPEGDTPTFLSIIQNGLTDPLHPEWGGWVADTSSLTQLVRVCTTVMQQIRDGERWKTHIGSQATIWRWREAYQGDFAARMQWTLGSDFKSANHAPVIVLNSDTGLAALRIKARFGETVKLDASQSWDPDLETHWSSSGYIIASPVRHSGLSILRFRN